MRKRWMMAVGMLWVTSLLLLAVLSAWGWSYFRSVGGYQLRDGRIYGLWLNQGKLALTRQPYRQKYFRGSWGVGAPGVEGAMAVFPGIDQRPGSRIGATV